MPEGCLLRLLRLITFTRAQTEEIAVCVKVMNGGGIEFSIYDHYELSEFVVRPLALVRDILQAIITAFGNGSDREWGKLDLRHPLEQLRLTFQYQHLEHHKTLRDYEVEAGDVLKLWVLEPPLAAKQVLYNFCPLLWD
jgi:hypothetical protein